MTYANPSNITRVSQLVTQASIYTDNKLGIVILLIIWLISFIGLKVYTSDRAFATSAFITGIIGIIMRLPPLRLINDTILFVCIVMAGLSYVFLLRSK